MQVRASGKEEEMNVLQARHRAGPGGLSSLGMAPFQRMHGYAESPICFPGILNWWRGSVSGVSRSFWIGCGSGRVLLGGEKKKLDKGMINHPLQNVDWVVAEILATTR